MDWNTILSSVLEGVLSLMTLAVGVGLTSWLEAKKQKAQTDKKNAELASVLGKAEDAVNTAVGAVNQTIVSGTKGTDDWTGEKKAEAYETAAKTAMGVGKGGSGGQIEYSDEFQFLDDNRVYKIKLYGNGMPLDGNAFVVADITNLAPLTVTMNVGTVSGVVKTKEQTA